MQIEDTRALAEVRMRHAKKQEVGCCAVGPWQAWPATNVQFARQGRKKRSSGGCTLTNTPPALVYEVSRSMAAMTCMIRNIPGVHGEHNADKKSPNAAKC
eukprot:3417717-Amphidinium_carterae.1